MTAAITAVWWLAACAALVGLCMALACADRWLDYLTSRRRMRRQLAQLLRLHAEETDPS